MIGGFIGKPIGGVINQVAPPAETVHATGTPQAQAATAAGTVSALLGVDGSAQAGAATTAGVLSLPLQAFGDVQVGPAQASGIVRMAIHVRGAAKAQPATVGGALENIHTILAENSGSGGRRKVQPPDPWWWRSPYEDLEELFKPPSPEEVEEIQRKKRERQRRVEARTRALLDEAERKELSAAARDTKRPYEDRFANAFALASRTKWKQ